MPRQRDRVETTPEEREYIAGLAVSVFNLAFDDHRIFDDGVPWCLTTNTCGDRGYDWEGGRDLTTDDIKITQVWSKNQSKAAHLGQPNGKPYYRLGIRFTSWRRKAPDSQLGLIIHELGHLIRESPPHRTAFWHRIADAASNLCERYNEAVRELGFEFSTHYLKNDILNSIRYASRDEMDADRDEILHSTAKRLDYPSEAVGNMHDVSVGSSEYAQDKADDCVPITEVDIAEYATHDDQFVWSRMVEQAPAGFAPDERFTMTTALPVADADSDGGYESRGTTAEWQAVAVKRIWEHTRILKGDRVDPPKIPVTIGSDSG